MDNIPGPVNPEEDHFAQHVRQLIRQAEIGLDTRVKDPTTQDVLRRLCIAIQESFQVLITNSDSRYLYDLPVIYGKIPRGDKRSFKIRVICQELMGRFFNIREAIAHSPLWEDYLIDNDLSPEVKHWCGILLYTIIFASSRLVECPDDVWFAGEEQYLPLWKLVGTLCNMEHDNTDPLCAILCGTYAEITVYAVDSSRPECTMEEAQSIISYCMGRVENYLKIVTGSTTNFKPNVGTTGNGDSFMDFAESVDTVVNDMETDSIALPTPSPTALNDLFRLFPMNAELEMHFICRFLGCLQCTPQRNDSLRKAVEEYTPRILEICLGFLRLYHRIPDFTVAPAVKLLANMFVFPSFAKQFVSSPENLSLLLNIPPESAASMYADQCVTALLEPHFWTPGDPVGALTILEHHIACLHAFSCQAYSETMLHHLRQSGALVCLCGYAVDSRFFDPRRTAGKEDAVRACIAAMETIRHLACEVFLLMAQSPDMRKIFSRLSFFLSKSTWSKCSKLFQFGPIFPMVAGKICSTEDKLPLNGELDPTAKLLMDTIFPHNLPWEITEIGPVKRCLSQKFHHSDPHTDCITARLLGREYYQNEWKRKRHVDYGYMFHKLRTLGAIELPVRAGTCCSSVFVGPKHETAILRTDTGHLIGVNMENLQLIFMSYEDWYHKEQNNMTTLPMDCNKFITTSKNLVSQASPRRSHLWLYNGNDKCRRLGEYENIQFLRPSTVHEHLAVGHAPLWRKRHGYYYTLDMELQKKITLLGPLSDEEKHPSFPSFHPVDDIVICMGSIWDTRSAALVHRFDHFGGWGNCVDSVFHSNGHHVIINTEVWDLRNYCLLQQVDKLKNSRLNFNSSGDVIFGKHGKTRFDEVGFFDAHDYSEIEYVPFPGYISETCLDRFDHRLIVSWTAGFPVVIEIGGCDNYE